MSMEINGSYNNCYNNYKTDYAKQLKAAAKETETAPNDETSASQMPVPQDEYISSEKSGDKPSGLYRIGRDENGEPKIFYDDPQKSESAGENGQQKVNPDGKQPEVNADNPEKPTEKCTGNTDQVDREIEKLKEKKKQLEQQIQSDSSNEKKVKELEKELAQVESELSQKDNDAYRMQHSFFSE